MVSRFLELAQERKALRADVDALRRRIQILRRQPDDEAARTGIERLARERGGLQGLLRKLNGRETFNFLTDEGLLPNYAFPEAGVTLKSVIYRSREPGEDDDGADGGERDVHEYVRPAAAALGELAPENTFYAGGNRVRIDRIDRRVSPIEAWRLCPSCDHCARVDEAADDRAACPRCGDAMWADAGQRREMLPLRMVRAAASDRRARIADDRDDREPLFYTRQIAADFEPAAVKRAWAVTNPDAPFGFEYVESATFREMNFGRFDAGGQPVAFAGLALPRDGFRVCRRCGAVQQHGDDEPRHASTCAARKAERSDVADCLYLYREFRSEAVQMLLPVLDAPGAERRVASFVAALELGLRRHFSGRIDHLRATTRRVPGPAGAAGGREPGAARGDGGGAPRRYLLLYDTVPSGTRLPQGAADRAGEAAVGLRGGENGPRILRLQPGPGEGRLLPLRVHLPPPPRDGRDVPDHRARDARPHPRPQARAGGSAQPRRARRQRHVRQRARGPLRRGAAPGRGRRRAGRAGADGPGARQAGLRADGRRAHVLRGDAGRSRRLGRRRRTQPPRLPDTARPARARPAAGGGLHRRLRVPPRGDGRRFVQAHGPRPGRVPRLAAHLARPGVRLRRDARRARPARRRAGGRRHGGPAAHARPPLGHGGPAVPAGRTDAGAAGALPAGARSGAVEAGGVHGAVRPVRPAGHAGRRAAGRLRPRRRRRAARPGARGARRPAGPGRGGRCRKLDGDGAGVLRPVRGVAAGRRRTGGPGRRGGPLHLHDDPASRGREGYRRVWNGVLRLFALLQFLPGAWWTTRVGVERGLYPEFPPPAGSAPGPPPAAAGGETGPTGTDWEAAAALADPAARPLLAALSARGAPAPEVGFELADDRGAVRAEAELAWPAAQVAVLLADRESDAAAFRAAGWQVFAAGTADAVPAVAAALS